jgi:short-subunit dehydrogenase
MFNRIDLSDLRAVITGASSGIGAALARALAAAKVRLTLAARAAEPLEALARELRSAGAQVVAVPTDVTVPADRQRLIEQAVAGFGGIDLLVNNAGIGATGSFADASEERLRRVFEVNFFGATELTRLAIPHLRRGRTPAIINVASIVGRRGIPGYSEYGASKFALVGWSEALRAELARDGIHVLIACPGPTQTDFNSRLVEDRLPPQQFKMMSADRCAALIVRALRGRRNEVVMTFQGRMLVQLNRWLPRVVDRVLARDFSRAAQATPPTQPETETR